jgi:flavin reductase (DIM6/NTAB) family NADH-FMN oxidoreductase RutF
MPFLSHDPPIIAFSVLAAPSGQMKDTGRNILATGEFVVNLVSEEIAEVMNMTCVDAPANVSEIDLIAIDTLPSTIVRPPRLARRPVALECRIVTSVPLAQNQAVIFGRVECVHVPDEFVVDEANCVVDTPRLRLIGAMHAARFYSRTGDLMEMIRPTWAGWGERNRD